MNSNGLRSRVYCSLRKASPFSLLCATCSRPPTSSCDLGWSAPAEEAPCPIGYIGRRVGILPLAAKEGSDLDGHWELDSVDAG